MDSSWIVFIDLILLLATVLLVLLMWLKPPQSEPAEAENSAAEPPHLREWEGLKQELIVIAERCKDIAKRVSRPIDSPQAAKPVETALTAQLGSVGEAFKKWLGAVRRSKNYALVYEPGLGEAEDQLSSCLRDSLMGGPWLNPLLEEEIRKKVLDAVKMAVQLADRDLDRDRLDGGLQQKLGDLAKCAKYELYSPKRGEEYRRPGADRKIRVEKVLARGLRDTGGKIVMPPEIEEMR